MRVLLVSPTRLMDLVCGDDVITELLLAHPPEDIRYTPFAEALADGRLRRARPLAAWGASLAMHSRPPAGVRYRWEGLPPLPFRLLGKLLPDRPDVDVQWLRLNTPDAFDLVHAYTYPVWLNAAGRRLPLVLSTGSGNLDLLRHYHGLDEAQVQRLVRRDGRLLRALGVTHDAYATEAARLITVPSEYGRRLHLEAGVPEHKLRVVRIGFEDPAPVPPRAGDGTVRFAMVGHHFFRKGGRAIALAFDRLRRLHPEARLTIVSAVSPAELGISLENVTLIPQLSRTEVYARVYPQADVLLLPSLAEGYGMSAVEAMSFGLPVIASNISALPELVKHEATGLLVEPGDAEGLFAAMRRLMEDLALTRRLGAAGRLAFEAEHALSVTNARLAQVYQEALGSPRWPGRSHGTSRPPRWAGA